MTSSHLPWAGRDLKLDEETGGDTVTFAHPSLLRVALARESLVPNGLHRVPYPTDLIDIRGEVARALSEHGITMEPLPFESLHQCVPPKDQLPMGISGAPTIQTAAGVRKVYLELIRYLAREVLQFDVVFEANPPLRFHFPVPMPFLFRSRKGMVLAHHSDTMVGDPFEQINCWFPLMSCRGTNTLQYASLEQSQKLLFCFAASLDFDARRYALSRARFFEELYSDQAFQHEVVQNCEPLEIDYGEVALFDARLIHATAENVGGTTRVSIDFRLLPIEAYEVLTRRFEAGDKPPNPRWSNPLKGGFYDERSAYEL
jgi:hypothetical protein